MVGTGLATFYQLAGCQVSSPREGDDTTLTRSCHDTR
jgi:hypothetical protein